MEDYSDYAVYCMKFKTNQQIFFYSKMKISEFAKQHTIEVLYPMQGSPNDSGTVDFEQFVEYSHKFVVLRMDDFRSVSLAMPAVEVLYRRAIRRIEFLQNQPDEAKIILKEAMEEMNRLQSEGKKLTAIDYRNEIMKHTDRMIDDADGKVDENKEKKVDMTNVIDFRNRLLPNK